MHPVNRTNEKRIVKIYKAYIFCSNTVLSNEMQYTL